MQFETKAQLALPILYTIIHTKARIRPESYILEVYKARQHNDNCRLVHSMAGSQQRSSSAAALIGDGPMRADVTSMS